MRVLVLNPQKVVYEGNAKEVILPGEDGEISVLDFHQAFLHRLRNGSLRIMGEWWAKDRAYKADAIQTRIMIKGGIAKMMRNDLVVMTQA